MNYVDGFVAAVPAANKQQYIEHAAQAAALFKDFGVLRMVECWGDDVPAGNVTDFRRAVNAQDDEIVVFSWFEWPDKATRDAGMQSMRDDPRLQDMAKNMPFDGKRLIYGGFQAVVDQ
ncbi:hypothetical protein LCGC14_2193300 [marine sediment metagenome]|uniref:RNA signal recognition particle 4.5S RNA n=1 Tax=marine sediment metagenome TaxID=412755 RepID=A0A0F9DIX1_9ZZZZ